jgi:hypothetical protein
MIAALRLVALSSLLALCLMVPARAQTEYSIEKLLESGWDIAGYVGTFDNRSTILLFRHKEKSFLVQCSTLHDVTRKPRLVTNCYELR